MIDITFDFFSDTPPGRDPDSHSPTLRRYHQRLWSKPLPNGEAMTLSMNGKSYLGWRDFVFGSDAISNSYRHNRRLGRLIPNLATEAEEMFRAGATIGAYTIFPSRRVDGKNTINGARGMNARIADRFDLTLECIRRHYAGERSPLRDVLIRYQEFFELFLDFQGYVDFFHFQDLVTSQGEVRFYLPLNDFDRPGLPADPLEYQALKRASMAFIAARAARIAARSAAGASSG